MKTFFLIFYTSLMITCSTNSGNKKTTTDDFLKTIQGTWKVSEIKNISKEELAKYKKTPFLKIEEEKISGNNGCNNYFSSIENILSNSIKFSHFGETKMMCSEMKISDTFNLLLSKTQTYSVTKKNLTFFNTDGKKILVFIKV